MRVGFYEIATPGSAEPAMTYWMLEVRGWRLEFKKYCEEIAALHLRSARNDNKAARNDMLNKRNRLVAVPFAPDTYVSLI